ncbi:MAG: hypothetical protein COB16_15990 [Rhodobacteraceae bacterium]|nr:MAG: hypothetical protein COB16_15990 [Paracoccaceae bacterium]
MTPRYGTAEQKETTANALASAGLRREYLSKDETAGRTFIFFKILRGVKWPHFVAAKRGAEPLFNRGQIAQYRPQNKLPKTGEREDLDGVDD